MASGYILVDSPNPTTAQGGYPRRGGFKPSGTCIVHTSEGAWQAGVDSLTNLVRTRADYGCYHRACDWEDIALYYPWEWESWQDTETNPWAVGIAAACRTTDWRTMPADIAEGYYRNMGRMAADFVNYMKSTYGVTVPLKRISGAQARAGVPGFAAHGDSGVSRSDPGADFDWTKFFNYTRQALGSAAIVPQSTTQEDKLSASEVKQINDHATAQADRVIEYIGAVMVGGYTVGDQKLPGATKVDIENQKRIKALTDLVAKALATPDLTADQITEAVKAGLADGVDFDATVTVKKAGTNG